MRAPNYYKQPTLWILSEMAIYYVMVILSCGLLFACSSGYQEKDGKITFNGKEITDKTLVVLNDVFAKSDTAAWYKEYVIQDADVLTFTAMDEHYAKDKNTVFYCDEVREGQNYYLTKHSEIEKIDDADVSTFNVLSEGYAKDSKRGYSNGIGFNVKDAATLEVMEGRFVKDKYQVYFNRVPVKGADVPTFRIINNNYAKDTASIYFYGSESNLYNGIYRMTCDANSFTPLEYPFSKDKESAFFVYSKINHSDAATFKVISYDYSKDKDHVFIETRILETADPASFTMVKPDENSVDENNYAKDSGNVFWKDKKLKGVYVPSFKLLGLGYATDGRQVYYQSNIVKNANPATFKIGQHSYGDWDAEDGKHKFLVGKLVEVE